MQNLPISHNTPDLIGGSLAQTICSLLHLADDFDHLKGKDPLSRLLGRHTLASSRIIEKDFAPTNVKFEARPWRFVMLGKPLPHLTKPPRRNVIFVDEQGYRPQSNNIAEIVDTAKETSAIVIRVSRRKKARTVPITELALCQPSQLADVIGGKCNDSRHSVRTLPIAQSSV